MFERNKNWYIVSMYVLVALLTYLFQTMPRFFEFMGGLAPNFMITAVIATAAYKGPKVAGWLGFASGFLMDALAGRLIGFNAVFLMMLGYFTGVLILFLIRRTAVTIIVLNTVALVLHGILYYIIFYLAFGYTNFLYAFVYIITPYLSRISPRDAVTA